jgi:hypothetical protein
LLKLNKPHLCKRFLETRKMSENVTIAEFNQRWHGIVADKKIKSLGHSPAFKALRADCAAHKPKLKPCSSRACQRPIKPLAGFSKEGLYATCRDCDNDPAGARASEERKMEHREGLEVAKTFDRMGVEDEARIWLLGELRERGVEATGTLEFRKADVAVRLPSWPDGLWLRVQLKANGVYKEDGTPKAKEWSRKGDGCAIFNDCDGYDGLLMVFVKSRLDADGEIVRSVWVCNGGDDVGSNYPHENSNDTLGKNRIALGSVDKLVAAIEASTLPRMTLEEINLEIVLDSQRKEATLMLALRVDGFVVEFKVGNQGTVDCFVNGVPTQVKMYNLNSGMAHAGHCVNGEDGQAYGARDGIEQLLEAVIVKSDGKYYLLYAIQPLHALLYKGTFAHLTEFCGQPKSPGNTSISPPLQIYKRWLTGKVSQRATESQIVWLEKPAYNWRLPVEIEPGEHGIPPEWLEEAAQEAKCPAAFPSQAKLDDRKMKIQQSEAMLVMNAVKHANDIAALIVAERKRIAALVERAEDAANRTEDAAASSSGAGPSYVNCNINNITYNVAGDIIQPPAKRLKQATLPFLQGP